MIWKYKNLLTKNRKKTKQALKKTLMKQNKPQIGEIRKGENC